MEFTKESLNDFVSSAPKPLDPPAVKFLRPSGEIELLKPLTPSRYVAKRRSAFVRPAPFPGPREEFRWFVRSLAVGGGVAAMVVFTVLSGIFISVYEPPSRPAETDIVRVQLPPESLPPISFDFFTAEIPTITLEELRPVRRLIRTRPTHTLVAAYKPRRVEPRHMVTTDFVPTKLVIYPENGVIKTRIEPQLTAVYNSDLPFPD